MVRDNPQEQRYEAKIQDELAVVEYQLNGDTITFTHTEVPEALAGGGVAGKLVSTALDDARARGLAVVPLCPYVASYIRRHPDYAALVPTEYQHLVQRR